MATEILRIRSVNEYFEEFGREALYKNHEDKKEVKKKLIDAFHKEIFGLVAMLAKKKFDDIPPEGDPEALRIAHNIVKDATKKWKKLVDKFETYRETSGCIKYNDISMVPEEKNGKIGFEDGQLVVRNELVAPGEVVDDNGEPLEVATSGYVAVQEDHVEPAEETGKPTQVTDE